MASSAFLGTSACTLPLRHHRDFSSPLPTPFTVARSSNSRVALWVRICLVSFLSPSPPSLSLLLEFLRLNSTFLFPTSGRTNYKQSQLRSSILVASLIQLDNKRKNSRDRVLHRSAWPCCNSDVEEREKERERESERKIEEEATLPFGSTVKRFEENR